MRRGFIIAVIRKKFSDNVIFERSPEGLGEGVYLRKYTSGQIPWGGICGGRTRAQRGQRRGKRRGAKAKQFKEEGVIFYDMVRHLLVFLEWEEDFEQMICTYKLSLRLLWREGTVEKSVERWEVMVAYTRLDKYRMAMVILTPLYDVHLRRCLKNSMVFSNTNNQFSDSEDMNQMPYSSVRFWH